MIKKTKDLLEMINFEEDPDYNKRMKDEDATDDFRNKTCRI